MHTDSSTSGSGSCITKKSQKIYLWSLSGSTTNVTVNLVVFKITWLFAFWQLTPTWILTYILAEMPACWTMVWNIQNFDRRVKLIIWSLLLWSIIDKHDLLSPFSSDQGFLRINIWRQVANANAKWVIAISSLVFDNICPQGPSGWQVWHPITGCHLCVGLTPTSHNAEDQSQYDPGCWTGCKTPTLNFGNIYLKFTRLKLSIYLFIWGFTSLSTLYRSYHDG